MEEFVLDVLFCRVRHGGRKGGGEEEPVLNDSFR